MRKKLILTGLLAAAMAFAQGGMGGGGDTGGMGGGGGMGGRGGGGDMGGMGGGGGMPRAMPNAMERMTSMLNLNKDQKKAIKAIMDEGQKESAPVHEEILKDRGTVAADVAAGKSQDEINAAIGELAAAQSKMTQIELHAFTKVFQSLEKDQQSKARELLALMNGIFKGKNWDATPAAF